MGLSHKPYGVFYAGHALWLIKTARYPQITVFTPVLLAL
jgi:hypothetical protein